MAAIRTGVAFADNNNTSSPLLQEEDGDDTGEVYTQMDRANGPSRKPLLKHIQTQNSSFGQPSIDEETEVEEFWDQFQSIAEEGEGTNSCASVFAVVSQICKAILYGLLFLLVLCGLLASRLALVAMSSNIGKYQRMLANSTSNDSNTGLESSTGGPFLTTEPLAAQVSAVLHRDGWVYLLIFGVIFPYLWTFIQMLGTVAFSKQPNPSVLGVVYTVLMETIHSFGLAVFLWKVLPVLNIVEASVIFCAVGVIPSLLHIFRKSEPGSRVKNIVFLVLDILACVLQLAGIIAFVIVLQKKYGLLWEPVVAALLISIHHIENYLSTTPCFSIHALSSVATAIDQWKSTQVESRAKQYIIASALKIGLTFAFAFALVEGLSTPDLVLNTLATAYPDWTVVTTYTSLIILIIVPLFTYYFAFTSSQLLMQRICYALPVVLHTPIAAAISTILASQYPQGLRLAPQIYLDTGLLANSWHILAIGLGACWLSQIWISRHIWFPTNLRLEHVQNLFVLPSYCCVHLEQSLAYNRVRSDRKLHQTCCDTHSTGQSEVNPRETTPMIYVCATMWHENKNEMLQVLKSILRLDEDQATKSNSNKILQDFGDGEVHPDYYEFEVHILFDDAMKLGKQKDWALNDFVVSFVSTINEAASSLYNTTVTIPSPVKIATPYGGRLEYTLPGENKMVVHLKDKNKIRHRKRWSQIMYMYYLLGFKNLSDVELSEDIQASCKKHRPAAEVFHRMPDSAVTKSDNTFLLALDGDVDFRPQALQLLVDRLKKNKKVGVVCGRIHPIGSGPMVWYQKFEYAIGHWLQKAAEHVLGCVLCAPGCFSLFRGSAIMDDNVMKTYATEATEARHYVQYDQGEDRWLCTLLLQRGYRVEYVAASDAFTYAPETFKEFFNQRRRWGPSTMANILDLLASWRKTVKHNSSISMLYILYQAIIFFSSILGPATIVILIAGAIEQVFELSPAWSLVLALIPPVLYLIACFTAASDTQISAAAILSAFYSVTMMAVMIGSIVALFTQGFLTPAGVFLILLCAVFITSAILHPQELLCLLPGILYYITIPSGYLLLIIYSMANMNVVSWGTRETAKKGKVDKPSGLLHSLIDKQLDEDSLCSKIGAFLSQCCGNSKQLMEQNTSTMNVLLDKVDRMERQLLINSGKGSDAQNPTTMRDTEEKRNAEEAAQRISTVSTKSAIGEHGRPSWMVTRCLRHSPTLELQKKEEEFWEKLIERYLKPIEHDAAKEAQLADQLKQLRNNVCFAFFMANALWIAVIFFIQLRLPDIQEHLRVVYVYMGRTIVFTLEPLTLTFLTIFGITLILQFLAMLWHRWSTFKHIMSATELNCSCGKEENKITEAEDIARELQRVDTTKNRTRSRQMSIRQRFETNLDALGQEMETGGEEVYANLPAGKWKRGLSSKRLTLKARVQRLSVRPSPKPRRLGGVTTTATDEV